FRVTGVQTCALPIWVTRIVKDLKDFSRSERDESWKLADIHAGLESTLNIIWNELKYNTTLEKHYGELPPVECLPSELNQVFMNMLMNAGQAIGERGTVRVSTGHKGDEVWVEIADSGPGIAPEVVQRGQASRPDRRGRHAGAGLVLPHRAAGAPAQARLTFCRRTATAWPEPGSRAVFSRPRRRAWAGAPGGYGTPGGCARAVRRRS